MDDLERMLAGLKAPEPPDLPQKTISAFRRRRRKFMIIHASASMALISSGAWLLLPATGMITPAQSGLPLLQNLVGIAAAGFRVELAISGIAAIQSVLSTSLGAWNWLGLVALGVGVMLGMNAVLPGRNNYF